MSFTSCGRYFSTYTERDAEPTLVCAGGMRERQNLVLSAERRGRNLFQAAYPWQIKVLPAS